MNPFDDVTILGVVRNHPAVVDALIWRLGFEPPQDESERFAALKALLREGNDQIIAEVRQLLPKTTEASHDCYCGGCSGVSLYTGEQAPADTPSANPAPKPAESSQTEKDDSRDTYKTKFYLASSLAVLFLVGLLVNVGQAGGRAYAA